jgi:hypothetical protein
MANVARTRTVTVIVEVHKHIALAVCIVGILQERAGNSQ